VADRGRVVRLAAAGAASDSVYVANNGEDTVSQYGIGAGGVLSPKHQIGTTT
jgi:hypothetical protein